MPLLLALALSATLQANPRAGAPIVFQADHDGAFAQWFTLFVDGHYANHVSLAGDVDGVVTIALPDWLPAGQHTIEMGACNDALGCALSEPLRLTVDPATAPLAAPKNLRLRNVVAG